MTIQLEKLDLADAKIMAEYGNNNNIWVNLSDSFPHPYFVQDAIGFVENENKKSPVQSFKITKNSEFIGVISFNPKKGIYKKNAEIGYWIAEPFWGQGIGSKAVELILKYGSETFPKIEKIIGKVFHKNIGSMIILERNGFKREAIIKKEAFKANQYIDIHYFYIYVNS